jgi:hypothetical protein
VNNAVARVASVLAIAILGIVMVKAFGFRLNNGLMHLSLPAGVLRELQTNAIKLAGLPIPSALAPSVRADVSRSIGDAFVFGFRVVILICAGLSLASTAVAWLMIPKVR